jgi:spore coat polysaccharide biosynthesis protein SpsF (cytidylyltransferase family)
VKIGIAILCRYDSRRLPGKALIEIGGRAVLEHIADRARRGAPESPLVVATSNAESDLPIADYCRQTGLRCFRGSLEDVAARFLACALTNEWEFAVRVNGDNLFLDPDTLQAMLTIAQTGMFDFVTNVPGRTFPYGMSVEIVRTAFYERVMASVADSQYREHVTSWLYDNWQVGKRYVFENKVCPEAAGFQLALDTPEDLARATDIVERAGSAVSTLGLRDVFYLATHDSGGPCL